MAKGENIFKRKDGRWEARYIKGYEVSGKIKYGFCYGRTYREAKEKVTKCKAALANGAPLVTSNSRHRFSFYCDEWLRLRKPRIKEATYIKYNTILERHIKPKLGVCFPLGFTTALIDEFTRELLFEGELAPKTVHDILVVLHGILKYMVGVFPGTFPAVEVNYPKVGKKEMRVLSREEQKRFMEYLMKDMDECKFGVLLALFTGMRIGELCALRWENISLTERAIRIAATLQRLKDTEAVGSTKTRIVVGTPKSDTSVRLIPMTDFAFELCERMNPKSTAAYVLTGTKEYMEPRTLQYRMEKYTHDCELEGIHCHTLRHTFATRAIEVGFEIKSLSEILGHATTAITLDRYVHSSMELKRDNMNKLTAAGL
ncbi:tyrosine-type recombinase/integrase [Hominifimenecus sp. rT4P-3]|uniref:tyrosine-type recombinase/integrase n=1 Tax=Hominifimenecus sp. rT4P-3 TaxID=3242979 RepID=UPI003DA4F86D